MIYYLAWKYAPEIKNNGLVVADRSDQEDVTVSLLKIFDPEHMLRFRNGSTCKDRALIATSLFHQREKATFIGWSYVGDTQNWYTCIFHIVEKNLHCWFRGVRLEFYPLSFFLSELVIVYRPS